MNDRLVSRSVGQSATLSDGLIERTTKRPNGQTIGWTNGMVELVMSSREKGNIAIVTSGASMFLLLKGRTIHCLLSLPLVQNQQRCEHKQGN